MKNFKRILALVLVVMMVVPMMMTGISAATAEQTIFVSDTGFSFAGGNWKAYSYYPYGDLWGADFAGLNNAGRADVDADGQICVWNLAQTNGVFNCPTPITALSSTNTTALDGFYFRNGNLAANNTSSGVVRYPEVVSYAFSQEEFSATLSPSTFTWTDGFAQSTNCSIRNGLVITLCHTSNDLSNSIAVFDQIKAYVIKDGSVVSAQGYYTENQGKTFGMVIGYGHETCIRFENGVVTFHMEAPDNAGTYGQSYTFDTLDTSSLVDTKSYYFTMGVGSDDAGNNNTNGSANLNLARIGSFTYDAATDTYTMDSTNKNAADWTGNGTSDVPTEGTVVVQGDYTYTYSENNVLGAGAGWNVVATDKTKTSYGEIAAEINGAAVVAMSKTFDGCTAMTAAPAVPASVKVMYNTFKGCVALTVAPTIPDGVTKLYGTFKNCTALTTAADTPATVVDMSHCYSGCSALTTVADIPASVATMTATFKNCTALTAAPAYSAAVITEIFNGCTALTGDVALTGDLNKHAFKNTAITSVTVGNVTKVERGAFSNCSALANVSYAGSMADYLKIDVDSYNGALKTAKATYGVSNGVEVLTANGKTYITELYDIKDVFIAKGQQTTYRQVANNKVVMATSVKTPDGYYAYTLAAGNYTAYVRYADGTFARVHFTVA